MNRKLNELEKMGREKKVTERVKISQVSQYKWIDSPYLKLQAWMLNKSYRHAHTLLSTMGARGTNGGIAGKRNRAHTLVAHHQVCQTLKENKSTVSREQGIMGSCVTLTCRHLFQSRCLCCLRSVDREKVGRREIGGCIDRVSKMSIWSTEAGCNASSSSTY